MDVLQMSLTCFLLVVIFHPVLAQAPCPGCSPGYFVKVNCSNSKGSIHGVQCQPCTDCSAANLKTLYECSTYADSVCVNKSAPVVPTPKPSLESTSIGKISVETPSVETIVIVVGVLLVCFLLLLGPTLTLLFCRGRCYTKLKDLQKTTSCGCQTTAQR